MTSPISTGPGTPVRTVGAIDGRTVSTNAVAVRRGGSSVRRMCVVGAGVAGLSAVLSAVDAGAEVVLVTTGTLETPAGNTARAQGGVAAAIAPGDRIADHVADTLAAGHGLVDPVSAEALATQGRASVLDLLAAGFPADRDADGALALGLEGAHGRHRIVHAGGDRSGAVLEEFLGARVRALVDAGLVELREQTRVSSLIRDSGAVTGVRLAAPWSISSSSSSADGSTVPSGTDTAFGPDSITADAVVLATGGFAGLYPVTSNDPGVRGQGMMLAARAGAILADLEFVQFHPTALPAMGDRTQAFLVSEAVRGAGAVLRDDTGRRFMVDAHPLAELAPRDVVARNIDRIMRDSGASHVWLDATEPARRLGSDHLRAEFPTIAAEAEARGFDMTGEPIPVAPAAHFTMGGVATDLDGRTSVPGLFAAGEVASTGVHGANRLASNSLLEGLVFGKRAGLAAAGRVTTPNTEPTSVDSWEFRGTWMPGLLEHCDAVETPNAARLPDGVRIPDRAGGEGHGSDGPTTASAANGHDVNWSGEPVDGRVPLVSTAMAEGLGIVRDSEGIARAGAACAAAGGDEGTLGHLVAHAAAMRLESRGAHQRSDHPELDPAEARSRALRLELADQVRITSAKVMSTAR